MKIETEENMIAVDERNGMPRFFLDCDAYISEETGGAVYPNHRSRQDRRLLPEGAVGVRSPSERCRTQVDGRSGKAQALVAAMSLPVIMKDCTLARARVIYNMYRWSLKIALSTSDWYPALRMYHYWLDRWILVPDRIMAQVWDSP